jgi:hypothetical protein
VSRQLSPQEARQLGRIGGLTTWTRNPERARAQAQAAHEKWEARFASDAERRLFYAKFSRAGVQARRARKAAQP